jgi:hypothetical protein
MDVAAYEAFEAFTKERDRDFRSIASKTRGAVSIEELHSEAWLAAEYHSAKRGFPINWTDPADQSLIFGTLTIKHVKRPNAERKLTISLDASLEGEEGSTSGLIDLLPSENAPDPLELLERREEEEAAKGQRRKEEEFLESYSQSVAYNIILWHFNNIRTRLAAYLVIDRSTLRSRVKNAARSLKVQPSIFDGIERITSAFLPPQGQKYRWEIRRHLVGEQWTWDF